jgi:PAT family beta-lactamase induction signal transducer AmpG
LLLTGSVLQAWLKDGGINLTDIGLFALVGLPYTLKFLWAPLFDRYVLPGFGRRRGWLIAMQLALARHWEHSVLPNPRQTICYGYRWHR